MNLNIFLSIFFASGLFVILRYFGKTGVNNFHGIVINYFAAAGCSFLNQPKDNIRHFTETAGFLPVSFSIGFLFIVVFLLTAHVTQVSGVGVSSVASKLSMVIPISAGIFLYQENMSVQKLTGLALALMAVSVINLQDRKVHTSLKTVILLPFILFIGCGLVDTSIKFAQHYYISDANRQLFIMSLFGSAGLIGLLKLLYDRIKKDSKISRKSVAGGIILGICNYLSLYFLIRSFEYPGAESSKVFAFVNVGVVILSMVWATFIFQEPLNKFKVTGIFLSISAILILYFV